MNITMPYL